MEDQNNSAPTLVDLSEAQPRLFAQIGRILKSNDLSVITADVVEAARSTLVIGAT